MEGGERVQQKEREDMCLPHPHYHVFPDYEDCDRVTVGMGLTQRRPSFLSRVSGAAERELEKNFPPKTRGTCAT